jgi:hypothetical protein
MARITWAPARRKPLRLIAANPVYQAFARKPMPDSLRRTQSIDVRLSYEAAIAGGATQDDRETLAGMANCIMVLAERHCITADLTDTLEAQRAILRADERAREGKTWNFDGPGRQAMLKAMDMFDEMAASIGQGAVSSALVEVMARTAAGQVHRFEVTK